MIVKEVQVSLKLSKALSDKVWKTVEVSTTASLEPGEEMEGAQDELYDRLAEQIRKFWSNHKIAPKPEAKVEEKIAPPETPKDYCMIHQCQMKQRKNRETGNLFYSHYIQDEHRYCNGRRPEKPGRTEHSTGARVAEQMERVEEQSPEVIPF